MILKILQNPVVRAVGIGAILYFALFSDRENPNSLSQRLSSDNIKNSVDVVKQKTRYIAYNIGRAQEIKHQQEANQQLATNDNEADEKIVSCGQEVKITYFIFNQMAKELREEALKNIIVGSKQNIFFENLILGMKENGSKQVELFPDSVIEDAEIAKIVKAENTKVTLHILVSTINPEIKKNITCKK